MRKLGQYESIPTSLYWKDTTLYMACANGSLQVVSDVKAEAAPKKAARATSNKKTTETTTKRDTEEENSPEETKEENDETVKKSVMQPSNAADTKRPKLSIAESDLEDGNESDKENEEAKPKTQSPVDKKDEAMEDTQDDDSLGPETQQLPSVRSVLEDLGDSDADDLAAIDSPAKKSSLKEKVDKQLESLEDSDDDMSTNASPAKKSSLKEKVDKQLESLEDSDDDMSTNVSPAKKPSLKKKGDEKLESLEDSDDENKNEEKSKKHTTGMDSDDDNDDEGSKKSPATESYDEMEHLEDSESKDQSAKKGSSKRLMKRSKSTQEEDDDDDIFDDMDSNDKEEKKSAPPKVSFIDDEAEDSNEMDEEEQEEAVPAEPTQTQEEVADTSGDADATQDEATGNQNPGIEDDGFPIQDDDEDSTADDIAAAFGPTSGYSSTTVAPVLPEPQAAFAPSSTPLDLARRFLCWNSVGSITLMNDDMGNRSTVDINFTDKAFRRPVSFTDNMGFILGAMGDDGAIFATDLAHDDDDVDDDVDDDLNGLSLSAQTKAALRKSQKQRMKKGSVGRQPLGSSIYFHRFETFASLRDKDWYLTLPDGERVLGCACGQGWAAAITRYVPLAMPFFGRMNEFLTLLLVVSQPEIPSLVHIWGSTGSNSLVARQSCDCCR